MKKSFIKKYSALLCILLLPHAKADVESFQQAYKHYLSVVEQGSGASKEALVDAAERALEEGFELLGNSHKNTAHLAKNYATALYLAGDKEGSVEALKNAVQYYEAAFGKGSAEARGVYFDLIGQLSALLQDSGFYVAHALESHLNSETARDLGQFTATVYFYNELADYYIKYQQYKAAISALSTIENELKDKVGTDYEKWLVAVQDRVYWLKERDGRAWLNFEDATAAYNDIASVDDKALRKQILINYVMEVKNHVFIDNAIRVLKGEGVELDELYPSSSESLVNAYMMLAQNILNSTKNTKKYVKKAIHYAKELEGNHRVVLVSAHRKAAQIYIYQKQYKMAIQHAKYSVKSAIKMTSTDRLSTELYLAYFILGNALAQEDNLDEALEAFEMAENISQKAGYQNLEREFEVKKYLVATYMAKGEVDKATEVRIAAGKLNASIGSELPKVLTSVKPAHPARNEKSLAEGDVLLRFSVSDKGFADDIKILNASDPIFLEPSIVALKKYRYAPKVVNGTPMVTEGLEIKFIYTDSLVEVQ